MPCTFANRALLVQIVPIQFVRLGCFMGLLEIVTLHKGCNGPSLHVLDTACVVPANTNYKYSVTAAFNTKPMSTKEIIHL